MNPERWKQLDSLLQSALARPPAEREAYLRSACAGDAALEDELRGLLKVEEDAGSFLERPAIRRAERWLDEPPRTTADPDSHAPTPIQPGAQLGTYRIESIIGEGGMGVVYRALDTNLNRTVAVKFLFDDLADAAARHRFQREARTASSLNHPHILTVHDAGDFEGRQYLVTEFVDGGTLRTWARAEKRSWREIVGILVGVADGLAAAHAAGILHRDIKPDNILVGRNGYAKLSDFGLAKLEESSTPDAVTRTLGSRPTRPGIILGTIAYMSPEQASGKPTDARSDIFSFGVVLYELLAGKRPFEAATDLELLQHIRHGAAPPLGADLPMALRMVVEKALENSPADRYQSTRDLVVDLRRLARQSGETAASASSAATLPAAPARRVSGPLAAALLLTALLAAGLFLWRALSPARQATGPAQVVQFDIAPPTGTIFSPPITRQPFAISPDGSRLAFTATGPNGANIWVRDLASVEMRPVPGTQGAWSVFWSPDSRSIYYAVKRTLKQVSLVTGSGGAVGELPFLAQFGSFRPNGNLLIYLGAGDYRELSAQDGNLQKVAPIPAMRWPEFVPGSDRLVYALYDGSSQRSHIMTAEYTNPRPISLMETNSRAEYAPPRRPGEPAHLLFIRAASLLAQPFDADHARLAGDAFPIAQNIVYYGPVLSACFSVSRNGVLVYQAGFPNADLKWYDRKGNEVASTGRPAPHWGQVRLSRDGRRVAATDWIPDNGGTGIWIFDANGPESRRLTFPPEVHRRPVWSPDGKQLAVGTSPTVGGPQLGIIDLSGNGTAQPFVTGAETKDLHMGLPTDWSADGRFIALDDGIGDEVEGSWIADFVTHRITPLFQNRLPQAGTAFSPDGKRVAFVSLESGRPEVYVQAFESVPAPHVAGERRQVSKNGGWLVRWRSNGSELFYVSIDNILHAVPVQGPLQFGEPQPLFTIPGAAQYGTTRDFQFDVSPDGQRFIMPNTGSVAPPPLTVIENWPDKFRRQ